MKLPGGHIPGMGTFFLHASLAGEESDSPLKLPGGHIPCVGTSFLHVWIVGVERNQYDKVVKRRMNVVFIS